MEATQAIRGNGNLALKPWIISMVGGLFFGYLFMQMTLFNPLAETIIQHYSLTSAEFGGITGAYFLAIGLMAIPAGIMTDILPIRRLMPTLMLLITGSLLLMPMVQTANELLALRFAQGMIHAFSLLVCLKLASQWIPGKNMAMASSLIVTLGLLGGGVAQPLFTYLDQSVGFYQTIYVDAAMGAVLFLIFLGVIRDNDEHRALHSSPHWADYKQGLSRGFLSAQNWLGGIYVCALNLPVILLGAGWGNLYLEQVWSISGEQAAFTLSLLFLGMMIGSPLMGFVSDRMKSRIKPMLWGSIISLLVFTTLLFFHQMSTGLIMVVFFLLGLITASQVLVYPMITESNLPKYTGSAMSIVTLVLMFGNSAAQSLYGTMLGKHAEMTPTGPVYTADSFTVAMWMVWLAIGLSILLVTLMQETHHETKACRR